MKDSKYTAQSCSLINKWRRARTQDESRDLLFLTAAGERG